MESNVIWIDIKAKNLEYLLYYGAILWECRNNGFPVYHYSKQATPNEIKVIQYLKSVIYNGHIHRKLQSQSITLDNPFDYLWEHKLISFIEKLRKLATEGEEEDEVF